MDKPNVEYAFDEFLASNKEIIYGLFQKWRLQKHRFQTGTKVRIDADIYILASVDACTKYCWINIRTGTTWGGWFQNNIDPCTKLPEKWELIYPIAKLSEQERSG